jgi:hypothetical protein
MGSYITYTLHLILLQSLISEDKGGTGDLGQKGEMRNAYRILVVGRWMEPPAEPMVSLEDDTIMYLTEIGCKGVDWNQLDRIRYKFPFSPPPPPPIR